MKERGKEMEKWIYEIIEYLSQQDNYVSSNELATHLGITSKYIHTLLDSHNEKFEALGFQIDYKLRQGYRLIITDYDLFYKNKQNQDPVNKIICYLLECNDYIRIDDLADMFYLSRSSMDRIIKESKDILARYELTMQTRAKYGIIIKGTELNKRICYAHHIETLDNEDSEHIVQRVQVILYTILNENNYTISDAGFNNLVFHILILLRRLKEGNTIQDDIKLSNKYEHDIEIARLIIKAIEKDFSVSIPELEATYITLHLVGKQIISENSTLDENVLQLVDTIFETIYNQLGIDLLHNLELRIMVALHMQPMLARLKYGLKQDNPLLHKIKRDMRLGYELAIVAKSVIIEKTGLDMDENELSYLAMHFALAIEKLKTATRKFKVIIVCATGRGTSRLLQYQLMSQYNLHEDDVTLSSLMQLTTKDMQGYTCILSTVPIPFSVPLPVILIHNSLDETSIRKINDFLKSKNTTIKNKPLLRENMILHASTFASSNECLLYFITQIAEEYNLPQDFIDSVIKRETLGSTYVGNECCLPHPFDFFPDEPILAIMILDKAVNWGNETVRYLFFFASPKEYDDAIKISDALTRMVCSKGLLQNLCKDISVSNAMKCLFGDKS